MRRSGSLALVALVVVLLAGCTTATLLPDGRVLLLGIVAKAWDPATGSVGNLSMPPTVRVFGSATLLNNGLVLIAGGSGAGEGGSILGSSSAPSVTFATAELYDPATDSYTPTGSMAQPRAYHTATLLADGTVLIVGGGGNAQTDPTSGAAPTPATLPPPEIYDPATGTFRPVGSDTLIPHMLQTATLLPDGKVLIAGGMTVTLPTDAAATPDPDASGDPSAQAELYDPATGTFGATGSMTTARIWNTATALADGRVLMVGGTVNVDMSNTGGTVDPTMQSAEIYDPASGTFSATGSPGAPRFAHGSARLADGRVLVTGGLDVDQATTESLTRSAEVFDPASGTFAPTGDMVGGHAFHTATTLPDGKVLIAGFSEEMLGAMGTSGNADLLSSAELYDPGPGTFSAVTVEPGVMPSFAAPQ